MKRILSLSIALGVCTSNAADHAFSIDDYFQRGRWEAAFSSGVLFSPPLPDHNRPDLNYSLSEMQLGWMLTDVKEWGCFRGNLEITGKTFGGAIFEGRGSYLI